MRQKLNDVHVIHPDLPLQSPCTQLSCSLGHLSRGHWQGKSATKERDRSTNIREFHQDHHLDKTAERGCNSTRSTTEAAATASTLQEQHPVYNKGIHPNICSTSASTLQQQHPLYNKSIHSNSCSTTRAFHYNICSTTSASNLQQQHPLYNKSNHSNSCSTTSASNLQQQHPLYNKSIHSNSCSTTRASTLQQTQPLPSAVKTEIKSRWQGAQRTSFWSEWSEEEHLFQWL